MSDARYEDCIDDSIGDGKGSNVDGNEKSDGRNIEGVKGKMDKGNWL